MKTFGRLWQCYRHEPALDNKSNVTDFHGNNNENNNISFKFEQKIRQQPGNDGTFSIKMGPLKYLNSFWITLKILLINCAINF